MNPCHHPDHSSLVNYAAGGLPDALAMVIACHLSHCDQCRAVVAQAEQIGGLLLEDMPPVALATDARENMLALLDSETLPTLKRKEVPPDDGDIPQPLHSMIGTRLDDLHWRTLAPGMKQFVLPARDGKLRLLKISPGTSMPVHSHSGSEVTMVIKGSYTDELGRFRAGDVADLETDTEHQPVADTHEECICLIATDAPLKFKGLVPRLLQPFFGL